MTLKIFKDKRIVVISLALALVSHTIYADSSSKEISWMFLIFGLLGGLALFLYGMELMSEGLKKTAGNKMLSVLAMFTRNRVIALVCGAFVTMVIQIVPEGRFGYERGET